MIFARWTENRPGGFAALRLNKARKARRSLFLIALCGGSYGVLPACAQGRRSAPRAKKSIYPEPLAGKVGDRIKRPLGDLFGLTIFGVNLTTLKPGAMSALRHAHTVQDEFVYIVEGSPVLVTDEGETQLSPGMCAGFKAGTGNAHHLINRGSSDVVYLEVGDRSKGDAVDYPDEDLVLAKSPDGQSRTFLHKDGKPY